VPLFVILHCWRTVGLSSVEALLTCPQNRDDSIKFTVTSCTPLDISPEIRCPDFRLNPLFFDFANSISKDSGSNVDSASFLRVDIEGDSDAQLAPIASNEPQSRTWIFNVTFDYFAHPALVYARPEDAASYVRATLNQTFVKDVDLFSFAVPQILSSFFDTQAMPVTGVLYSKKPIRLRTVRSIFQSLHPLDLSVRWVPIRLPVGHGNSFTSHDSFQQFLRKSTKEITANPNLLLRVDVTRSSDFSDEHRPKRRGPQGPRKQKEPFHADMESIMALPEIPGAQTKRRAGRGASSRSACSRDETATPPPTPPAAAPRLASEPSVIPRRQPPPGPVRRSTAAQPCRRVPN
jgi:hypothetical protein